MTQLHKIIATQEHEKHATHTGTQMHALLAKIHFPTNGPDNTDTSEITRKIKQTPDLAELFSTQSKTEAPIAGTINDRFISRRIDRLLIDHATKTIKILDYKTDTNPNLRKNTYIAQINEYAQLLRAIYPTYTIFGYILWTHNFLLENIHVKAV